LVETGTSRCFAAAQQFSRFRSEADIEPDLCVRDKGQQHLPGDEAWLAGEHRPSGEKKYYLASLPAATALRSLAVSCYVSLETLDELEAVALRAVFLDGIRWAVETG
jgi:hypothetical protein